MIQCNHCGKQIADDAVVCPYCGVSTPHGDALAESVAAARIGDQDAISALYEKTYSKVYYTVKSMIKDEDAVFDIVQDAYIKAFAHLDSFRGDTKFLPWVRQIAANTALDWMKKKRPMLFTELNSGDEQDTPVEELFADERSDNLPDHVIDQKETKRLIREIIEELPEDQRAVIGMFYYEEMSVKEIAASMSVSESAVKSRLMYGRNKIEKKVLELEKQGTKLYSLSPLPFLLLLFRSLKANAAEMPDGRILQAILASQPVGAAMAAGGAQGAAAAGGATGTGAAGAGAAGTGAAGAEAAGTGAAGAEAAGTGAAGTGAAGAEAAGTGAAGAEAAGTGAAGVGGAGVAGAAGAGAVAAAGGLGALKIGLITLAAVAVVGIGAYGAVRIASGSAEPGEPSSVEDVIDREEPSSMEDVIDRNESEVPEFPIEESQPTEDPAVEDSQSAEEETESSAEEEGEEETEEETSDFVSYIFSDMPVAAYEVTGLGVGRSEGVYEGEIYIEEGDYHYSLPLVRLTPGENTFVIFCMAEEEIIWDEDGMSYSIIRDEIHSPSGSGKWEAITYTCLDGYVPKIEGYSQFVKQDTNDSEYYKYAYDEETFDGCIYSLVDPWMKWIRFAEIYHPDAQQDDTIYVIEVEIYPESGDYEEIDPVLARMVNAFEDLGATSIQEISVEEALIRFHIVVSEEDAD